MSHSISQHKQVFLLCQKKGGVGKSVFSFMLAEKHHDAFVIDADDATTTTKKQLAYRDPVVVSFLDPVTQRIDRNAFNNLFESIAETEHGLIIVDTGASVAEQLPKYFTFNDAKSVRQILDHYQIQLKLYCIIAGGNNFKSTMSYLDELIESNADQFEIIATYNRHFPMNEPQLNAFYSYCQEKGICSISFDLVNDKGEMSMRTVANVLQAGKGLSGLKPFDLLYFKKSIEELEL